jgi:hypothetical protein
MSAPHAPGDSPRAGLVAPGLRARVRAFGRRHGRKLWWVHTAYALGLGAFVATFAQKGFEHARFLVVSIVAVWIVVVVFFRYFGTGASQDVAVAWAARRLHFVALTYVLKNLYQSMLFFLLPFYAKSATLGAPTQWAAFLLGTLALLSTLDLVFDRFLMRFRGAASAFYALTLFAAGNLAIPALFPSTRTLYSLLGAALLAVLGLFTLHLPARALGRVVTWVAVGASALAALGGVYLARRVIPPVPMYVASAAVGPSLTDDGRLAVEATTLHVSVIERLVAVTEIVVPGGTGDRLLHVWRRDGDEVFRAPERATEVAGKGDVVRLRSTLSSSSRPSPSRSGTRSSPSRGSASSPACAPSSSRA